MSVATDPERRLFGSILNLTDFSPTSTRAFVHALALALTYRAQLPIAHVRCRRRRIEPFPRCLPTLH